MLPELSFLLSLSLTLSLSPLYYSLSVCIRVSLPSLSLLSLNPSLYLVSLSLSLYYCLSFPLPFSLSLSLYLSRSLFSYANPTRTSIQFQVIRICWWLLRPIADRHIRPNTVYTYMYIAMHLSSCRFFRRSTFPASTVIRYAHGWQHPYNVMYVASKLVINAL